MTISPLVEFACLFVSQLFGNKSFSISGEGNTSFFGNRSFERFCFVLHIFGRYSKILNRLAFAFVWLFGQMFTEVTFDAEPIALRTFRFGADFAPIMNPTATKAF